MKKLLLLLALIAWLVPMQLASDTEERECKIECTRDFRACKQDCNSETDPNTDDCRECYADCQTDKTECDEDCSGDDDGGDDDDF